MAVRYLMVLTEQPLLAEPKPEASYRPPSCSATMERASEVALDVSSSNHEQMTRDMDLDRR